MPEGNASVIVGLDLDLSRTAIGDDVDCIRHAAAINASRVSMPGIQVSVTQIHWTNIDGIFCSPLFLSIDDPLLLCVSRRSGILS